MESVFERYSVRFPPDPQISMMSMCWERPSEGTEQIEGIARIVHPPAVDIVGVKGGLCHRARVLVFQV